MEGYFVYSSYSSWTLSLTSLLWPFTIKHRSPFHFIHNHGDLLHREPASTRNMHFPKYCRFLLNHPVLYLETLLWNKISCISRGKWIIIPGGCKLPMRWSCWDSCSVQWHDKMDILYNIISLRWRHLTSFLPQHSTLSGGWWRDSVQIWRVNAKIQWGLGCGNNNPSS
jgi:hypothetical protein